MSWLFIQQNDFKKAFVQFGKDKDLLPNPDPNLVNLQDFDEEEEDLAANMA